MPVIRTLKIAVEAKRSHEFQSAGVSGEVTIDLLPGEDAREEFRKARIWLGRQCREAAQEEIGKILYGEA